MVLSKWQQLDASGRVVEYEVQLPERIELALTKAEVKELRRFGHIIFTFSLKE